MATLRIQKISGVILITQGSTQNPKAYFGWNGRYQVSDDNTTISIRIGTAGQVEEDVYTVAYGDLTVGSQVAATMSTAKVLLNSIFGT